MFRGTPRGSRHRPRRRGKGRLLRLLIEDKAFRIVLILLGSVLLGAGVALPRIWVVSPPGYEPPVKIRLVNLVQAWSLRRSAVKLAEVGKADEAAICWRSAIASHPGSAALYRGALGHWLATGTTVGGPAFEARGQLSWLLRLSGTNQADVALALRVYDRLEEAPEVLALLQPREASLSTAEEAHYVKALFRTARWDEFNARWERAAEAVHADPEVALYRAAYVAGWGPSETAAAARQQVEEAQKDPERKRVAFRLKLILSARLMDAGGVAAALRRLEGMQAARLTDYLAYWKLLSELGRKEEARALAEQFERAPETPAELLQFSVACVALGAREKTRRLLGDYTSRFGRPGVELGGELWQLYAGLLADMESWDELRRSALNLRVLDAGRDHWTGYSFFMEGRAAHGQGQYDEAVAHFAKAAEHPYPDAETALAVAMQLYQLGFPAVASPILIKHYEGVTNRPVYWDTLFECQLHLRQDARLLLAAAQRAYELSPRSADLAVKYAGALLLNRESPEVALGLTVELLAANSNSAEIRLNHALALARNQRWQDARTTLEALRPDQLTERQTDLYHLTRLEVHLGLEELEAARAVLAELDDQPLFPNQAEWLATVRARLNGRQGQP
ncbi:MAG: hypothetical protein FJ387_10015 [Verrucomicrobia bacterium]|nr:hypothetical protein [Verrucomicrobiota bacterium]